MGCRPSHPVDVYAPAPNTTTAVDEVSFERGRYHYQHVEPDDSNPVALRYKGEVTVLVTDMSGVTSMTKRLGSIHFAGIILKMRQLVTPIFDAYDPVSLETAEADNFTVAFHTPQQAIMAAMEARAQMAKYNSTVTEDFRPIIGGYGIALGTDTIKATLSGKLYGEAMDVAFRLGEDVAEDEILIDHKVFEKIKGMPEFKDCKFDRREDPEQSNRAYYMVDGDFVGARKAKWPYPENLMPEFVEAAKYINMLRRREAEPEYRPHLDSQIRTKLVKKLVIIMLGLDFGELTQEYGVMHSLGCMDKIVRLIVPILERYNGELLEETVFGFKDGKNAVLAALAISQCFSSINRRAPDKYKIPAKGIGLHYGDVLFVPNTDIHWGDPLNTSSKLAEDTAKNGELCITDTVYKQILRCPEFDAVIFNPREVTVSKVTITCYLIDQTSYIDEHVSDKWAMTG